MVAATTALQIHREREMRQEEGLDLDVTKGTFQLGLCFLGAATLVRGRGGGGGGGQACLHPGMPHTPNQCRCDWMPRQLL